MSKKMNRKITINPLFKTKDSYLASVIYYFGFKLDSTEWQGDSLFFVFENAEEAEKIVKQYYAGELKVDPRILFDSYKIIKQIIFSR